MSKTKKILKAVLIAVAALVVTAGAYLAYCFIDYYRLEDNIKLEIIDNASAKPAKGREYKMVSYNIGFGAYEPDYGFFMDGGTQSWAWSRERLDANLNNIAAFVKKQNADFALIQEVDTDSTRSYHFDERTYLTSALPAYSYTYAQNYDSPFLFYPFNQPHGKSRSCIMTFAKFDMDSAVRRSLPIENGIMKLLDLDRCYSVTRIPAENGKELVIINLHLSAYTSDGKIAIEQLKMVLNQMQEEYDKGNWCIAAGDFNKDVQGGGSAVFGVYGSEYNWAQPIPQGTFDGFDIRMVAPFDASYPVPSCRNADGPYNPDQYQITVDGFMVSANVEVRYCNVIDTGFAYSDHNPVEMTFILK